MHQRYLSAFLILLSSFSLLASAEEQIWKLYQNDSYENQIVLEQDPKDTQKIRLIINQNWSWRNDQKTNLAVYKALLQAEEHLDTMPEGAHVELGSWAGRPDGQDPYSQGRTNLSVYGTKDFAVMTIADRYQRQDVVFDPKELTKFLQSYHLILKHIGTPAEQLPEPPVEPVLENSLSNVTEESLFQQSSVYIVENNELVEIKPDDERYPQQEEEEEPTKALPAHLAPQKVERISPRDRDRGSNYRYRRRFYPGFYPGFYPFWGFGRPGLQFYFGPGYCW